MDVKQAVDLAKRYILDLYADERVSNVGLEEVDHDGTKKVWSVTVGFSRPWDEPRNSLAAIAAPAKRSYKTLRITDEGQVLSIRNRDET